ncbi:MAG: hypothetical protein ACREDE_04340, partial [Thermoplasmata archaeon]
PDPTERTAFELLVEPERRRAQRAGDAIERGGGAAGFFGRDDAVATVAQLFARQSGSVRGA